MRCKIQNFATRVSVFLAIFLWISAVHARPVSHSRSGGGNATTLTFLRQINMVSNLDFYYTDRGVLFNAGNGEDEGMFWPRGSGDSYMFGGGLWFATQKRINGKLTKLCDAGYNANSGGGLFTEGEASQFGLPIGTDSANLDAKYISYVSPRYDMTSGAFIPGSSSVVPPPFYSWPLWDSSSSKTFLRNYYFGDYISDVNMRNVESIFAQNSQLGAIGKTPRPAIVSQEDILNLYTDADTTNNPEYVAGSGYPLGIDVQEEMYTWGYGSYQNMVFLRYKVKNSSNDTLFNSWIAPAFDPDLDAAVGGGANDANSYVNDSLVFIEIPADPSYVAQLSEPYRSDPSKLNMAVQWRNYIQPPAGQQYGWLGVSLLETPVVDAGGNIISDDDSAALQGYCSNSLFQTNQLGLVTCKDWTILNDPSKDSTRYNFVSSGEHDSWNGVYQDQRLLLATGPFNLPPGKSAEVTVVLTIAQPSTTSYEDNFGAVLLLTELAHEVFGEVDSTDCSVNNFQVTPPSSFNPPSTGSGFTMEQPYPDPFTTNCTISYQNSVAGLASAIVTDVLGRTVETISLGEVSAGEHTLSLDGTDLPSGDYRVTVIVGSESASQMVIHVR